MVLKVGSESWSTAGDRSTVVSVDGIGRVGPFVCADMYSKRLVDETAAQSVDLLVSSAAWAPGQHGPNGEGERASLETGRPVLVCNRTGVDPWTSEARNRSPPSAARSRPPTVRRSRRSSWSTGCRRRDNPRELARGAMTGWMRRPGRRHLPLPAAPAWAQAPQRVVTVNLCLDQIALRLAAPGQLVGLSYLSHDPRLSVLADRARAIAPVRAKVD